MTGSTRLMDDLGSAVERKRVAQRVVSLVPSLTEAIAATRPDALVGATDWCTHPHDLEVTRVRGTKNPKLAAIRDLAPDVVIANKEENRRTDVEALRASGVQVWVTDIESVDQSLTSMRRMFADALGWELPQWLVDAEHVWSDPPQLGPARIAVPIWRDPWMVVGRSTFTGDLLGRLGLTNVFADQPDRYPHSTAEAIRAAGPDVVLLPDEPYVFSATDGPEAFAGIDCALVEGRAITWYGPSLVTAAGVVAASLDDKRPTDRTHGTSAD